MAKTMNADLAEAVEKLGEIGGMSEMQAQTWLATHAGAQIDKAQLRARSIFAKVSRTGKRGSAAPRRYRGNKKLATAGTA